MRQGIATSEKLARALEGLVDLGRVNLLLNRMILKARAGHYDDYKTRIPTPQAALIADLIAAGFPEMAERAIDGVWDSTPEEGAAWYEREGQYLIMPGLKPKP